VPFAHCIDCGNSALIDPSGRCPEGHIVGAAGARVAAAIGSATPHPDEPLPWVHQIELDPELVDGAEGEPRTVRPPSVPTAPDPSPRAEQVATDDLMRELHALGDLGDLGDLAGPVPPPAAAAPANTTPARAADAPAPRAPLAPAPPAPAPVVPAPVVPAPSPVTPVAVRSAFEDTTEIAVPAPRPPLFAAPAAGPDTPAPPSSPDEATDLASLANLAAAVRSLDEREAETTAPTPAEAPLFAASPPAPGTAHPDQPPAPTAVHAATQPAPPAPPAPPSPEPVLASSPFDGSFTARGDRPRRADARPAKRSLFRR
jgi:hypothetical protein